METVSKILSGVGKVFTDPSQRRNVLALASVVSVAGNKKLGLDMSPETIMELLVFVGGIIAASQTKEAVVARANAAGVAAAAVIVPGVAADAVVDAAAKGAP